MIIFIYFSDQVRVGQTGHNEILDQIFRGDPTYLGDIVLYGVGPFYYTIFSFCKRKIHLLLSVPFQIIIFSIIVCTQSKGVILSLIFFFILSLIFLKGLRIFMILSSILYIITLFVLTTNHIRDFFSISPSHEVVTHIEFTDNIQIGVNDEHVDTEVYYNEEYDPNINIKQSIELGNNSTNNFEDKHTIYDKFKKSRINFMSPVGLNSIETRVKAILVTMINSFPNIWFGHGAGTSQRLLPLMIDSYDTKLAYAASLKNPSEKNKQDQMQYKYFTGESFNIWAKSLARVDLPSYSLIDAHNMFFTELFNVGIIGSLSLFISIIIIIYKQLEVIRLYKYKNNYMNELLLLTLFTMLVNRMTDSLIALPFLWVILGINIALIKLRIKNR